MTEQEQAAQQVAAALAVLVPAAEPTAALHLAMPALELPEADQQQALRDAQDAADTLGLDLGAVLACPPAAPLAGDALYRLAHLIALRQHLHAAMPPDEARAWMQRPLIPFDYRSAAEVMTDGSVEDVAALRFRLAAAGYGAWTEQPA